MITRKARIIIKIKPIPKGKHNVLNKFLLLAGSGVGAINKVGVGVGSVIIN